MAKAEIKSNAKLNFLLLVHGRRRDGYHDITTLYVPIDLHDTLYIAAGPGDGIKVTCDDPSVPRDTDNLAGRAAELIMSSLGLRAAVDIAIEKRIPVGAGLAGGSSNAAAVLKALPWVLGRHLEDGETLMLAAELGSDVPFFLTEGWAFGRGRGEVLEPVAGLGGVEFVLAAPPEPVSTPAVYGELKTEEYYVDDFDPGTVARAFAKGPDAWRECFRNDLTAPAERLYPMITSLKDTLTGMGYRPALSGSGGAVFAPAEDRTRAAADAAKLRNLGFWSEVVRTI
ncbi:MAG: 4-(cytidine 5'-diphospho)-2-C-methyl-D-erythritol kinase [Candidatus Coatesbacteria bacterium]|nr:MAG: 4-(cytidine 5'-diphospho)-2-C-methyl-D-erythritol kinase [Candidatus Coatesbacteria bacterium]